MRGGLTGLEGFALVGFDLILVKIMNECMDAVKSERMGLGWG